MKTVKVSVNGQTSKLNDATFDLENERDAERLYNLFRDLSGNYLHIHTPEISASKEAPKQLVGKISIEIKTAKVEKPADFLDPTPNGWAKNATETCNAVLDLNPENIKFVTMLVKLAVGDVMITNLNHTVHTK